MNIKRIFNVSKAILRNSVGEIKITDSYKEIFDIDRVEGDNLVRLPKNAIKVLLMYFSICNSYGYIKKVKKSDICNKLNITSGSLDYCNKILHSLNIIAVQSNERGYIEAFLMDYCEQFKAEGKGGHGFMSMSNKMLDKLIKIEDVNALRIAVVSIIKNDIGVKSKKSALIKKEELKNIVPKYILTNKNLTRLSSLVNKYYVTLYNKGKILFNCIEENGKIIKKKLTKEYIPSIEDILIYNGYLSKDKKPSSEVNKTIQDLLLMCFEYGKDIIIDKLKEVFTDFNNELEEINNLGGLVRDRIETYLEFNYS